VTTSLGTTGLLHPASAMLPPPSIAWPGGTARPRGTGERWTVWHAPGLTETQFRKLVRVSYVKVAEFQRRGAVHFHAIVRLDAATVCRCPACLAPPPVGVTAAHLERAIRDAVAVVRVPCPPLDDDPATPVLYARWGAQLDVRNITRTGVMTRPS